jgi:hypothetical protein
LLLESKRRKARSVKSCCLDVRQSEWFTHPLCCNANMRRDRQELTMVRAATRRVGSSWSIVMVSLAIVAAVSRSARHDDSLNGLN